MRSDSKTFQIFNIKVVNCVIISSEVESSDIVDSITVVFSSVAISVAMNQNMAGKTRQNSLRIIKIKNVIL